MSKPEGATHDATARSALRTLTVAGLFAGIGGIEQGLHEAGHHTELLCEIEPTAARVLSVRFPNVPIVPDIRDLRQLPDVDLVTAGFPCQDLSQAGRTAGIAGSRSGLVTEVFRLVSDAPRKPSWLMLENVSFMLHLDGGRGMSYLTRSLEELGLRWAYRVVDTRAFGIPHRRQRVILLASPVHDPGPVLFSDEAGSEPTPPDFNTTANGFYWTEGLKGLGWAINAVPTLKGGSTIGIPSPPAIWMTDGRIVTPDIRDAERLQGFSADWTAPASEVDKRIGARWKLVGNAVSVPVAAWVGRRLATHPAQADYATAPLRLGAKWPAAAQGGPGETARQVNRSRWPTHPSGTSLEAFLQFPTKPLSERALAGFLSRAERSTLRFPEGLLGAVRSQLSAGDAAYGQPPLLVAP